MADETTGAATGQCERCAELGVLPTDPLRILERLPSSLFNRAVPPDQLPEAIFDEVYMDNVVFGELPEADRTLQFELARVFAQEKDAFRLGWRRAVADQLGWGRARIEDGVLVGDCPRAAGVDLDRVGEQFGVSRPMGFEDCCYWRLVVLMRFTPGGTRWHLLELCELYTGIRPRITEGPDWIELEWPLGGGVSFLGGKNDPDDGDGWFVGQNAYCDGDAEVAGDDIYYGYVQEGAMVAGDRWTYLSPTVSLADGFTLQQAIAQVRPAGVFVEYSNLPKPGIAGCYGKARRGTPDGFYVAPDTAE